MKAQIPPNRLSKHFGTSIQASLIALLAMSASCLDLTDPYVYDPGGITPPTSGYQCFTDLEGDDESLRMHFIDVGQADAIWIRTPDDGIENNGEREGYNILVDTGRLPIDDDPYGTGQIVIDYMTGHGEQPGSTIDFLVITHAHADHYGGAIEIMNAYDVVNILDPGYDNDNSTYVAYVNRAETEVAENGGQLYRPLVGTLVSAEYQQTEIFGSELETTIINSEQNLRLGESTNDQLNNTSIAMLIEYEGSSVLLMADCHELTELELVDDMPNLRTNILKVGHHGSATSSRREFLEMIFRDVHTTQRFAVVQAGRRDFSGTTHPAASTVSRILEYVPEYAFFSTQFEDEDKDEAAAPGDDHVQAVITSTGDIEMCYAPPQSNPTE